MKNIQQILKTKISTDILVWLIFISILFAIVSHFTDLIFATNFIVFGIAPVIPFVYVHFYLYNRYFLNRKFSIYIPGLIFLVCVSGIIAQYIADAYLNSDDFYYGGFLNPLLFIIITTGIKAYKDSLQNKIKLNEAVVQKASAELKLKEIEAKQAKTELDLLKMQINPHFLFNNLNNIYSLSLLKSDLASSAILKLSGLMRYLIDSSSKPMVPLSDELRFIENYIVMEELRLENKCNINFSIQKETNNYTVPPMLLIPFVENCFKHGISINSDKNQIEISIIINDNNLKLTTKNSIHTNNNNSIKPKGLGLINIQKRLNLLYQNNHMLRIDTENGEYKIYLQIIL